jgi:AraC-like DNA-binding protein
MVPDRVIRHASELGCWEMIRAAPDRRLRPHVRGYWGYDERTVAFSRRRELATVDAVLIVGFGEPIEVAFPSLGVSVRATAFVSGLSDCYAVVDSFGYQRGVQIDLSPLGAFMLVGTPMHELANRAVALEDLLGPAGAELPERLHDARGWSERFGLIDALLLERFAVSRPASPDAGWAWRRLRETGGRVAVGELAAELGCSRRHLTKRFGEEVGLPPKTVARLLRFGRAARLLGLSHWKERSDRPRLAEVALACGYYDQAHLNRDFREFAGVTPTELRAMLLPDHGGIAEACSWPETAPQFPSVQDLGAVSA